MEESRIESLKYYAGKLQGKFVERLKRWKRPIRVAVDVMGTDTGLENIIKGVVQSVRGDFKKTRIILVGRQVDILKHGGEYLSSEKIRVENADSEIKMTHDPTAIVRDDESSIAVGMELMNSGNADAFISFGNTGAILMNAMRRIRRLGGVKRPALMTLFPTMKERPSLVLDIGANADCKPNHLFQFGALGAIYAEQILGRRNPSVAILSIGEERNKGNSLTKDAYEILENSTLNFMGNIEGRDILASKADVIVCDGFVGNIILKFAESMYEVVTEMIRSSARKNIYSKLGGFLLKKSFKRNLKAFDYSEYGGAPLLGLDGTCIIGHGKTSAKAVKNSIFLAQQMIISNLNEYFMTFFADKNK